jgi:hypothetical protein
VSATTIIQQMRARNLGGIVSFCGSTAATLLFMAISGIAYIRHCDIAVCGWMKSGILLSGRLEIIAGLIALVGFVLDNNRIIALCSLAVSMLWMMIFGYFVYRF